MDKRSEGKKSDGRKSEGKKPDEKKPAEPKPEKPGAYYLDEPKKSSRRRKKTTDKDESAEAGPSSSVPSQPGYGPNPSIKNPSPVTPTQASQPPVPKASHQSHQGPNPSGQSSLSAKPSNAPTLTVTNDKNKHASSPSAKLAEVQTIRTERLPNQDMTGSNQAKPIYSASAQPKKILLPSESSEEKQSMENRTGTNLEAGTSKDTHPKHQSRPGGKNFVGTQGITVDLSANYHKLTVKPDLKLHRYSIQVSPQVKGNKLAQMIKDAVSLPEFNALRPGLVSDFAAFLLSPQLLPDDLLNVSVPYKNDNGAKARSDVRSRDAAKTPCDAEDPDDAEYPSRYHVLFDYIRTVDIDNDTRIQETADQGSLPIVQDLDIVLGHHRKLSAEIAMIGKRRAFPLSFREWDGLDAKALGKEGTPLLTAVRGFFSSVRLSTTGILVNVNVTHGPFYNRMDLSVWYHIVQRSTNIHDTKIPGLLKGIRVGLLHSGEKRVIRTISGFASQGQGTGYEAHPPRVLNPNRAGPQDVEFFEYRSNKPEMGPKEKEWAKNGRLPTHNLRHCGCNGSYISVSDYFRNRYPSYQVSETLPVVNVGNTQHPSYLPLSVCVVTCQPAKLNLSPGEMKAMGDFAIRAPYLNAASIKDRGFRTLGFSNTAGAMATLGVTIDTKRVRIQGHVLPQPTVMFSGNNAVYNGKSQWNLAGMKLQNARQLDNWACLNIHYGARAHPSHDLCLKNFVNVLKSCGIKTSIPHTYHQTIDNNLDKRLESTFREYREKHRLLLVILPNDGSSLYNHVKHLGDIRFGIHTVCVVATDQKFYNLSTRIINKKPVYNSTPYYANVALKVNIKNGGVNHVLMDRQLGFIREGQTMVIGIDVTHPSPGSGSNATSVAAMVASSDEYLAQWPAEIRINPARQEKVETLRQMLRAHLLRWKEAHEVFPEKLLIYRDGVSEGQYQMVLEEELPKLRAACESVYGGQQLPRVTLIIVGKRHHTRFYRTESNTSNICTGPEGNPPFGTVVDTVIVDQERNWDFFLQSHTALKGTARPAHYFVLVDEIFKSHKQEDLPRKFKNPSDYLYSITHNMCYLFCRATTAVSIPPAVYYADIACDRGRRWNSRVFDSSQSEVSGGNELQDQDVRVHKSLTDTMFYI